MKTIHTAFAILGLGFASRSAALQIGAWVGSASDTSLESQAGYYPQPTKANVDTFVAMQGRGLEFVEYYAIWPATWSTVKPYADIAANHGSTLFVTWQPNGYTAPDINSGKADAYLAKFAADMKDYPHEVWLRPLHEANGGDWYSWAVGNSSKLNTEEGVAKAFQRIVSIFRTAGATNVKWVWTTNGQNMTTGNPTTFAGTYPGDGYCDYISIDGYNFGTFHTVANSGWASSWQTFAQTFKPAYTALAGINKPIFIAEFGSSELGGDKARWYREAFASLSTSFPRLFALMVFSNDDSNGDWRINTSTASLEAWKECVAKYAASTSAGAHGNRSASRMHATGKSGIALDLAGDAMVEIRLTDVHGRLLEIRDLGILHAGLHSIDLEHERGVRLAIVRIDERTEAVLLPGG